MKFREVSSEIVTQARRDGVGSEAWKRLAQYFAENDDELRLLIPPINKKPGGFEPQTLTTLITLSDTITGTTTTMTTTTTSRMCSLPGICKRPGAHRSAKKKATKAQTRKRK